MNKVELLLLSTSIRAGSFNRKLVATAAHEASQLGANTRILDLGDYPLPIYDGDLEAQDGVPEAARQLAEAFSGAHAVFLACAEYNSSFTPLIKNSLDWMSRVPTSESLAPFKKPVFALGAASPGGLGGVRAMTALRSVLEVGFGALVLPEQVGVARAMDAFDGQGGLTGPAKSMLTNQLTRLIDVCHRLEGHA